MAEPGDIGDGADRADPPLRWLLRAIGRSWWIVLIAVVVAVGAAYAVTSTQPKVYRSQMGLVVGQAGGLLQPGFGQSPEPFTQTVTGLLQSDIVARQVVQRSNLRVSPTTLSTKLKVSSRPESTVLSVTYDSQNREVALQVLEGVARVFPDVLRERLDQQQRNPNSSERLSVTVFDPPRLLDKAVAPRPLRTTGIAGVLGLIIGIALAVARDVLRPARRRDDTVPDGAFRSGGGERSVDLAGLSDAQLAQLYAAADEQEKSSGRSRQQS